MKAELLILGVLHRGNFHPYEIKRRLTNAMIQCFTDVDVGTLYYAVRQLQKNQTIARVSQKRVVRGGIKTVYRITAAGKVRFQTLLNEQFERPGAVAQTLYVALLFLHLADRSRVASLLRDKITRQRVAIEELDRVKAALSVQLGTGPRYLLQHIEAQRQLDLEWLETLYEDVIADRIVDSPMLATAAAKARGPR